MRARRSITDTDEPMDINISPLIDMVFILLIFFIVTTVFVEETGVEVEKPEAASAAQLRRAGEPRSGKGGFQTHVPLSPAKELRDVERWTKTKIVDGISRGT